MTREKAREAAAVMLAWADGKEVECKYSYGWERIDQPNWSWDALDYRIKPAKTLRPWTKDEVPLGAWMRFKLLPSTRLIISDVTLSINFKQWLEDREHSLDGGKTWKPCGVEEESK